MKKLINTTLPLNWLRLYSLPSWTAFNLKSAALPAAHPEVAAGQEEQTAISTSQNLAGPNMVFVFMNISLAWIGLYLSS